MIIDKQVDSNWYSGSLGDKKGIFPIAYVELVEGSYNTMNSEH